jgi:cytidine deaminase
MNDQEIIPALKEEIKKAHAPVSGYLVACALVTERVIYTGHNYEHENPVVFEHAEARVLKDILGKEKNPKIKKIVMLGGGKVEKFKFYTPCFGCSQTLHPYIDVNTEIVLLPLKEGGTGLSLTFDELWESYKNLPYSKISSSDYDSIKTELESKTLLKGRDLNFMADLRLLGLDEGVEFYMTGSATGRGAAGSLILRKLNKSYRDIDLIAVVKKDHDQIKLKVDYLINKHYGFLRKENHNVRDYNNKNGVIFEKVFYYCGIESDCVIDFTFSKDFSGSFHYIAYEFRNWFHQIS